MASGKQTVQKLLDLAGVKINGDKPRDIKVHDERLYSRVLAGGSVALGESYMDGWWDCEKLDEFFTRVLKANLDRKVRSPKMIFPYLRARLTNVQSRSGARVVGKKHYDVGNDLYKLMLDKRMNYSCGYWKDAKNLDEAQEAKLDLICRKLGLKKGMRILDIGCGWGGFLKYASEKYGVEGVGITISKEQVKLAKKRCNDLSLEIRLQDYRDLGKDEKFDRIISIGMIEHVGYKNFREFMEVVNNALTDGGLFLLHTIGGNRSVKTNEPWIDKYIFANSMLPSLKQIFTASEGLLVLEDLHSFGRYYDPTLMAWHNNFTKNWDKIKSEKYDKRFKRMWEYYLLASAGSFRAGKNQVWQFVFSKNGLDEVYER